MNRILLVEDKDSLARMLQESFESEGFEVDWAPSGTEAIRRIHSPGRRYAAIVTDLRLPGADGLEVLRAARDQDPDCPVVVMTGYGTVEKAVEAMRGGAFDFVQKPVDVDHLGLLLQRCMELRSLRYENLLLREEFQSQNRIPPIIGISAAMRRVSQEIQRVAPTDSTVNLLGESGTGKELFARAIHQLSGRKNRPFVALNCAAIPETLLENELFGHEKGAYTGAGSRRIGKFELADGGTIFLDEIGDLGIALQGKILRVLEERAFERIGGTATIEVDVRIICATNRDLSVEVSERRFREDLFYRIHVFPVVIPPLRERREDIDALVDHFVEKFGKDMGRPGITLSPAAREALRAYDWPGNVRELENCLERAVILCEGRIEAENLTIAGSPADEDRLRGLLDLSGTLPDAVARAVETVERIKISEALRDTAGRSAAAERLGISSRTLSSKIRDYGLGDKGDE